MSKITESDISNLCLVCKADDKILVCSFDSFLTFKKPFKFEKPVEVKPQDVPLTPEYADLNASIQKATEALNISAEEKSVMSLFLKSAFSKINPLALNLEKRNQIWVSMGTYVRRNVFGIGTHFFSVTKLDEHHNYGNWSIPLKQFFNTSTISIDINLKSCGSCCCCLGERASL